MKITKFAAAAALTAAALGATASTASGQVPIVNQVSSSSQGVSYSASWAPDGSSVTTKLANGTFHPTADGTAVAVTAANGKVIGDIPMVYTEAGHQIRLQPQISSAGTNMTLLRPASAPAQAPSPSTVKNIDLVFSQQTIVDVAVGCIIGAIIGGIFFILPGIPGCIIGGVLGYMYSNGQL